MNGYGVILATCAGTFQRFQRAGRFCAVVDAITATDWNEAVQNVVQVSHRDFIYGEVTVIDAPLREIGRDHFVSVLRKGFVVLLQGGGQRQQVAAIGIRHNDQLAGAGATAAVITQLDLLLVTAAFHHFKGGRTCCAARAGPDFFAIQQHFC